MKECYKVVHEVLFNQEQCEIWKRLWKTKLHQHLKVHLWHILAKVIPTREVLGRKMQIIECYYLLCNEEVENYLHVFKKCLASKAMAFASK